LRHLLASGPEERRRLKVARRRDTRPTSANDTCAASNTRRDQMAIENLNGLGGGGASGRNTYVSSWFAYVSRRFAVNLVGSISPQCLLSGGIEVVAFRFLDFIVFLVWRKMGLVMVPTGVGRGRGWAWGQVFGHTAPPHII
jgi:hypothetical protein